MSEQLIFRDRRGTNAMKWNHLDRIGFRGTDLLGMWVADMDFAAPECVREALRAAADFGVFGYDAAPPDYHSAFIAWEREHHGLAVEEEWLRFSPGVVTGFFWLVRILTQPGDAVLIQTPVYYPFMSAIEDQGRKMVRNELVNTDGIYTIDFEDFERKIETENVKAFILCSPHNPYPDSSAATCFAACFPAGWRPPGARSCWSIWGPTPRSRSGTGRKCSPARWMGARRSGRRCSSTA